MLQPFSLDSLATLRPGRSRALTQENPTGQKGGGGKTAGDLGPSRKGSPCIRVIPQGETATLADIQGPGIITHIWITVPDQTDAGRYVFRDLVLRMYWDGEETPSVETPLGDFFLNGFGRPYLINSQPIVVIPKQGLNSYFPMPFSSGARITVENQHGGDVPGLFYQIDYIELDKPQPNAGTFHAQWRRDPLTQLRKDYILLDGVRGQGHYVGTFIALQTLERGWWGEGEMKFYLDGDTEYPTICGTGMEDYFGGAWSFGGYHEPGDMREKTYSTPYMGYPFYSRDTGIQNEFFMSECPPMRALYRFHIPDPVVFKKDLRVTLQQIGGDERGLRERQDDISSVAYWYQREPHAPFKPFPGVLERRAR